MPEMQSMPQGQASQSGGGGVTEALVQVDKQLYQIVSSVQQAPVPDEVKAGFAQALEAFRGAMEGLMAAAQGGAPKAQGPQAPQGAQTPEQGGNPRAVPVGG